MENLKRLNEELERARTNATRENKYIYNIKKQLKEYSYLFKWLRDHRRSLQVYEEQIKNLRNKIKTIQRNNETI